MATNRINLLNIFLLISFLSTLACDFWLSRFGQAVVFKPNLPPGITLKYDDLEGYKFLEEGFIHIIDEHTIEGQDTIKAIVAYCATDNDVFVRSKTTADKTLLLRIHILDSSDQQLRYDIGKYESNGSEDWIDLSNKRRIRSIRALQYILLLVTFVLIVTRIVVWIRRRAL